MSDEQLETTPPATAPGRPGFLPGTRTPPLLRPHQPPGVQPLEPEGPSPEGPSPAAEAAEVAAEPRGLRARAERLRARALGDRRPLGSPEGAGRLLDQPESSTQGSTKKRRRLRRLVDTSALGVRQVTKGLHVALNSKTGLDWVATPDECYEIGGPLASELRDRAAGSELAAAAAERSNLIAAGLAIGAYLLRVILGQPGGAELDAELEERIANRLARAAARRRRDEAAAGEADEGQAEGDRELGDMLPGGL